GLHGPLDGLLHGAPEGEAPLELLGDALGDQGRVGVGVGDLLDVDGDGPADVPGELRPQRLDRLATAADDHARLGRMDGDVDVVSSALDVDAGDAGVADIADHGVANLLVFFEQARVVLRRGVPVRRRDLVHA